MDVLRRSERLTVFYMTTRRLLVSGRVQGVGFRYALQHEAERLGLAGWVRNRSDGSVEALVQGTPEAVNALTEWARCGPPAARVDELKSEPAPPLAPPPDGFELRPTL